MHEKDVKKSVILACPESFFMKDSRQAGMTIDEEG
jgi:hypothetical protein